LKQTVHVILVDEILENSIKTIKTKKKTNKLSI